MTSSGPTTDRYRSLRASRVALTGVAPLVRFGLMGLGLALFLDQVRPLLSDGHFTWGERRVMGAVALATLGGCAAAGWVGGRIAKALAELIGVLTDGADAAIKTADLIESQLVPSLRRSVEALDRLAAGPTLAPSDRAASALRKAIRDGLWGRAEQGLQDFLRDHPGTPEAAQLAAELASARRVEASDLQKRLDSARASEDLGKAVACRDALTAHLGGQALDDLDRRTVRWAVDLVRREMATDHATPGLAAAVELASDSFGDRPEAAALRAALPELRRRAGLCPRCGRPSRRPDAPCPDCHAVAQAGGAKAPQPRASATLEELR